jgi:Zn-finger nucleic acid-binding protein
VWLDPGELDHLLAAVRPAVIVPDPEPARPAPPPRPQPQPEPPRGTRYAPAEAPEPVRFEEPKKKKKSKKSGKSKRYGGRYSKAKRLKDVIEDIFDFD